MSESGPRCTAAIDAASARCAPPRERELAEVRRRQRELTDLEAELVVAIDVRSRRIDDALDERVQAVPGAEAQLRSLPFVEHPAFASLR